VLTVHSDRVKPAFQRVFLLDRPQYDDGAQDRADNVVNASRTDGRRPEPNAEDATGLRQPDKLPVRVRAMTSHLP